MEKFDVVAAIIIKDDKYFIAQRNKNKHLGGLGISRRKSMIMKLYRNCLKREIKEELNIYINVGKKLGEENYKDEKINVQLHYFICSHYKW